MRDTEAYSNSVHAAILLRYHARRGIIVASQRVPRSGRTLTIDKTVQMVSIDLIFPVDGTTIVRDHGYALYAALSRLLPTLHSARDIGIFPIRGTFVGEGTLHLGRQSALRIRVPAERLPMLLPLAGKAIDIDGHRVRIGVPRVQALVPAAMLASSLVLIKMAHADERGVTPELFLGTARKQLYALGIVAEAAIPLVKGGPHAGEPRRRVIRVKDQTHAGYAMIVQGLSAEESVRLQEAGLGGRRLMGCGLFGPVRF